LDAHRVDTIATRTSSPSPRNSERLISRWTASAGDDFRYRLTATIADLGIQQLFFY
jgi:hypothetical protein